MDGAGAGSATSLAELPTGRGRGSAVEWYSWAWTGLLLPVSPVYQPLGPLFHVLKTGGREQEAASAFSTSRSQGHLGIYEFQMKYCAPIQPELPEGFLHCVLLRPPPNPT